MPIFKRFDHFDLLAPFYERVIQAREPETLVRLADLPVSGLLLDAGGGTGRVAQMLRGLAGGIIIADLSFGMVSQASQKDCLRPVNSHTEKLPFPDETFERIIMVDALHHVCSHAETAHEMWRVLKPGGRILIEEPDIRSLTVKVVAFIEKAALMRSHFISPPAIAALFPYPQAGTSVVTEAYNAWVIVEKG